MLELIFAQFDHHTVFNKYSICSAADYLVCRKIGGLFKWAIIQATYQPTFFEMLTSNIVSASSKPCICPDMEFYLEGVNFSSSYGNSSVIVPVTD